MSAKNIVFMISINSENKKEYEYSISSWKYFCEKNNAMLFLLDKTVIDQSEMHIIFQKSKCPLPRCYGRRLKDFTFCTGVYSKGASYISAIRRMFRLAKIVFT